MQIRKTDMEGLLVIEPRVFEDSRGYFFESFNDKDFRNMGLDCRFVQDNESRSGYGVVRGLHYQLQPKAQTKLVRVISGRVWDIALDLRKASSTFRQWYGVELSGENKKQLLIPKGFAHGFSVLSETAVVLYKCDELYAPDFEAGIMHDDTEIKIDWKIPLEKRIVSSRDRELLPFSKAEMNF